MFFSDNYLAEDFGKKKMKITMQSMKRGVQNVKSAQRTVTQADVETANAIEDRVKVMCKAQKLKLGKIEKPKNGKYYTRNEFMLEPRLFGRCKLKQKHLCNLLYFGDIEDIKMYVRLGFQLFDDTFCPTECAFLVPERLDFILSIYPSDREIDLTDAYKLDNDIVREVIDKYCTDDETGEFRTCLYLNKNKVSTI